RRHQAHSQQDTASHLGSDDARSPARSHSSTMPHPRFWCEYRSAVVHRGSGASEASPARSADRQLCVVGVFCDSPVDGLAEGVDPASSCLHLRPKRRALIRPWKAPGRYVLLLPGRLAVHAPMMLDERALAHRSAVLRDYFIDKVSTTGSVLPESTETD